MQRKHAASLLAVLAILNALDALFTVLWGWSHPQYEINPLGRALLYLDPVLVGDYKSLLSLLLLAAVPAALERPLCRTVSVAIVAAVVVYVAVIPMHLFAIGMLRFAQ